MCVFPSERLSASDIERVINSISDNNSNLLFNVTPVAKILELLKANFDSNHATRAELSLALSKQKTKTSSFLYGYGSSSKFSGSGACLSHDHPTQFSFVEQSLTLWMEIMVNMPRLWMAADRDILTQHYRLTDTGQGLNRLQGCPEVRAEMHRILSRVQQRFRSWVGLSVIHLGDRDVPNGENPATCDEDYDCDTHSTTHETVPLTCMLPLFPAPVFQRLFSSTSTPKCLLF